MLLKYKNKKVEQQFCSKHHSTWEYPEAVKEKLKAAENYIVQATSLYDIAVYPPFHFHQLKGKRKGEWSIYLGRTGYRVVMIPCDADGNEIRSGDIMAQCKQVKVILVTEVSNHYE